MIIYRAKKQKITVMNSIKKKEDNKIIIIIIINNNPYKMFRNQVK
jgi:hypothetical protein